MFSKLSDYLIKPNLYAPSTGKFWDDEHISKGMLEAHLNPNWDAATRKLDFVDKSVKWIASIAQPTQFQKLLDLGCGPGIYAERFHEAGYNVTAIDFSKRSIEYAIEQTLINKSSIDYHYQDYLTIDFVNEFDLVTLIYCDFGALSTTNRQILLDKIYRTLKPNGKFILDVFTPVMGRKKKHSWQYNSEGGFWSDKPYLCLDAVYHYEEDTTELRQSIVITEEAVNCYNIWEHFFTKETLLSEMRTAGFHNFEIFGDIAGKKFSDTGDTICGIFSK